MIVSISFRTCGIHDALIYEVIDSCREQLHRLRCPSALWWDCATSYAVSRTFAAIAVTIAAIAIAVFFAAFVGSSTPIAGPS